MLFSSYIFLFVFLPVTLGGFCLLARFMGPKPAKLWLTVSSLIFYGWWNPIYVLLIAASMLFNYWLGRQIGRAVSAGRSGGWLLFWGVTANLLLLGYYKYANFFVGNVNALCGTHWSLGKIILPLGISFFTFTQIAYLVDAARGVVCEYDLGDFLLFITFFPHLIAGPIIHHSEMMPQFREPKTYHFQWDNLAVGLGIFSIGLFKKVVIADSLSPHVAEVFGAAAAGNHLYGTDAWAGVLSYTFQIYFDFSGYSDMAIALARMFGIILPLNFNSPYKAVNIIEFWRRWHMTLSRFLRDYLYIPLGGNRHGKSRRYVNLILTMGIGGLWHGAAWTFVFWGLFHGICLGVNHVWQEFWGTGHAARADNNRRMPLSPALSPSDGERENTKDRARSSLSPSEGERAGVRGSAVSNTPARMPWPLPAWMTRWAGRVLTFFLVVLGWVLFRAVGLKAAGLILQGMFGLGAGPAVGTPALLKGKDWIWLVGLLAFVWLLPNAAQLVREQQPYPVILKEGWSPRRAWQRWRMSPGWAYVTAVLLGAAVLSLSKAGEFLYYNF
jgi:D-alanyl-lipoteichoic acid acyltransferase DltB (MBOAT superfamily)